MTAVANTSKKPSTHRCTTHQRQYSTIGNVGVLAPHQAGAVEQADARSWTGTAAPTIEAGLVRGGGSPATARGRPA